MASAVRTIGEQLRDWRQRRRMSQLDLACEADISTRHLSFVETGRSAPSREMVLHLAERLDVPLRERNALLLAAGFAPIYPEHSLHSPALRPVREAVERLLVAHEPYPALAVDRHWTLLSANRAVSPLLVGASPRLLEPPLNVLRLSLHPEGLAPRIANLAEWRVHVLTRLRRQATATGDAVLQALLEELSGYPGGGASSVDAESPESMVALPLRLITPGGVLSFLSATMVFGTPLDVTLAEMAVETFLPADVGTALALREMGSAMGAG